MSLELVESPPHRQAWEKFLELGTPSNAQEAYQYLNCRNLFKAPFYLSAPFFEILEPKENQLVFINGSYSHAHSKPPIGLITLPLSQAIETYRHFLGPRLQKLIKEEHDAFAALNSACYQEGLFLYLPPKKECPTPIRILHLIEGIHRPTLLAPRIHIFVGKQSQLSLNYIQKMSQKQVWVNGYIDCALEESSSLKLMLISEQTDDETHDSLAVRATLKKESSFRSCSVTNGGATSRQDYEIRLQGERAEADLQGIWGLKNQRQHHAHILMDHQQPNCRSLQKFKGILNHASRSSFEGKIYVHPEAQKTQAYQMNNNLILGEEASANCKPNLEIFADDVKASHGATVGQVDAEQLFYLTARGIHPCDARLLLLEGFVQEMLDLFEESQLIAYARHIALGLLL